MEKPQPKQTRAENSINLNLPYIPGVSEQFARAWRNIVKEHGLTIPTGVCFRATNKLKTLLVKPYPSDPPGQGIYEAKCTICEKTYIGETGLSLESRQQSHKSGKNSALNRHTHGFPAFEWKFLERCHENNRRKILESFVIRERNPELNKNLGVDHYVF